MKRGILIALGGAIVAGSFIATMVILDRVNVSNPAAEAKVVMVRAADMTRGIGVEVGNWPLGDTVLHNKSGGTPPFEAEFDFNVPAAGKYRLEVEYAAADPRPTEISINGKLVTSEGMGVITGGWDESSQKWMPQGEVGLIQGKNTLKIFRNDVLSAIRGFRFIPI